MSTVDAVSSKGGKAAAGSSFSKGQKVEARWGGKKRFFPAVITKVNEDGTLDLLYTEDNETEAGVDAGMVRVLEKDTESSPPPKKKAEDTNSSSKKVVVTTATEEASVVVEKTESAKDTPAQVAKGGKEKENQKASNKANQKGPSGLTRTPNPKPRTRTSNPNPNLEPEPRTRTRTRTSNSNPEPRTRTRTLTLFFTLPLIPHPIPNPYPNS